MLRFLGLTKPPVPTIEHNSPESIHLDALAANTAFTREGTGETVIDGSVGPNATLTIRGSANVRIMGNIGPNCRIIKEGTGTLRVLGTVADDLKLTVWGRGTVSFSQRPPEFVINTINNRGGAAKIICGVEEMQHRIRQGAFRHNLGLFRKQEEPEPQTPAMLPVRQVTPVYHQPPAPPVSRPLPRQLEPVDAYDLYTEQYIDNYKARQTKTVKARIDELNLTPQEEGMFEIFTDCIFGVHFEDVPVIYHDKFYELSTLLDLYKLHKPDPFTRFPFKLVHIQTGIPILEALDKTIEALKIQRAAAKVVDERQPGLQSPSC